MHHASRSISLYFCVRNRNIVGVDRSTFCSASQCLDFSRYITRGCYLSHPSASFVCKSNHASGLTNLFVRLGAFRIIPVAFNT